MLLSARRLRMLQRCMKAEVIYGLEHLRDGDLCQIIRYDRFLRSETHVCPTHTLQPFQGFLHPNGAGPSRHSVYREDNRRGRRHRGLRNNDQAE